MKRKLAILLVSVTCVSLFLSGCTPRLVGEAKAKEAGLALINLAFDANESEATVKLNQRLGLSYVNGIEAHLGDEEPIYYYTVKVGEQKDGNFLYYAEVNAKTGLSYRADKSSSLIRLTEDQEKQAAAIGTLDDLWTVDFSDAEQTEIELSSDWVRERFEKSLPLLGTIANNIVSDSADFPLVRMDCYVVFVDGTIYNVERCWPTMEVTSVSLLNKNK